MAGVYPFFAVYLSALVPYDLQIVSYSVDAFFVVCIKLLKRRNKGESEVVLLRGCPNVLVHK
jgi:hypothetical protein